MGGCRCTYRNCTVKSDGKTHFFHYPVFDKLRCHQWLTNAQRLQFLQLKVSQLKNRVICQHHFKNEMFMNYMKEKLTHSAIPTELGPYCTKSDLSDIEGDEDIIVKPEYIENELLNINSEKRAKFSVKYGDFLTNCEVMEPDYTVQPKSNNSSFNTTSHLIQPAFQNVYDIKKKTKDIVEDSNVIISEPSNMFTVEKASNQSDVKHQTINVPHNLSKGSTSPPKKSKITILSEEKYTKPLTTVNKLIPVPPSYVIWPPQSQKTTYFYDKTNYILEIENPVKHPITEQKGGNIIQKGMNTSSLEADCVKKKNVSEENNEIEASLSKGKRLSDERVAVIEEKRKFNKKLKDIVCESLNKLDEQDNRQFNNDDVTNSKSVVSHLTTDPQLPSIEKYLMKFFDDRLSRMEKTLLQRIDSNSERISNITKVLNNDKEKNVDIKKNTVSTQTSFDEKSKKKILFDEISQYLSLETKSKIFEELFIDKEFEPKSRNTSSGLKLRLRRQ